MSGWSFKSSSHTCALGANSRHYMRTESNATLYEKLKQSLRRVTLISRNHPQIMKYFSSNRSVRYEIHRHMQSEHYYIIHPFSMFRMLWEVFMFFIFGGVVILYPLYITYDNFLKWQDITIAVIFLDVACFFDMFITFITGYLVKETGQVIINPQKIAKKYFYGFFLADLITSLPVKLIIHNLSEINNTPLLFLMFTPKLLRLITFIQYLHNLCDLISIERNLYICVKHFILLILMLHWVACLNYIVPYAMMQYRGYWHESSWVVRAGLKNMPLSNTYLFCLFRSTCLIGRLSYPVYEAKTYEDLILESILFFIGNIVCTWIFVVIMQIMITNTSNNWKYQEIENQLQEYMRFRQLPMSMQERLLSYYNYRYHGAYFREAAITSLFTGHLKQEINVFTYKSMLDRVFIFRDLPLKIVQDIIVSLKTEVFLPGDTLVKAGTMGECMYFLARGTVAVFTSTGKEVCHLQDGSYFGEIALLLKDKKRTATVIAIEICQIYKLERQNFQHCFVGNRELYAGLQQIAIQRMQTTKFVENRSISDQELSIFSSYDSIF